MISYIGFLIVALDHILVSGQANPSPVDILIGDTTKKCMEATNKTDCYDRGCFYYCDTKSCVPTWASCSIGASNLCFFNCYDKPACEAVSTSECAYNDNDGSCTSMIEGSTRDAIPYTHGPLGCTGVFCSRWKPRFHIGPSDAGPCDVLCTIHVCCQHKCHESHITLADMCTKPEWENDECCKSMPPVVTDMSSPPEVYSLTPEGFRFGPLPVSEMDQKCQMHTPNPKECRKDKECYYNCGTGQCVSIQRVQPQCLPSCLQYCHDPCGCKLEELGGICEYNIINSQCLPRESECNTEFYESWECVKAGDYRASQGVVCYNAADFGNCNMLKNVMSVNLNGESFTDSRGVLYEEGDSMSNAMEDPYDTMFKAVTYETVDHPDFSLWKGFIMGNPITYEEGQCLRYIIPINDDGIYQLTIKSSEPVLKAISKRLWNVELAGQVVISNLDMFALGGDKMHLLTFSVSFRVITPESSDVKVVEIPGHPPVGVNGTSVTVGFCVGDCRLDDRFDEKVGKYIVAAFSVIMVG